MCSKVVTFNIKNDLIQRNQSKGDSYYFFYNILNQIREQYNILPILNNINQWDDDKSSQMRYIHHFKCFVCDFNTDNFNPWKEHIISNEHMSKYHKVNNLYSYSCGACKILFYGPEDLLKQHRNDMHCDKSKLPKVSILMAELMNNLYINSKQIYFCAHCKKFSETPLHNLVEHNSNNKQHYCKYCDITFLCSTEVLDCHSLSVEHVTLKCIYLIKEAIDFNTLEKHPQVQNSKITKNLNQKRISSKLPLIILNRFQNISELMPKCKFCNVFVDWSTEKIIEHICVCTNKGCLTLNAHRTFIKNYNCSLCNYITGSFSDYKIHVISSIHLVKVHVIDGFYSYFCNICHLYMYSSKYLIEKHWKTYHNKNIIELPLISHVLADNYKYVSNHPECEPIEYCDKQFDGYLDSTFYKCDTCKIDFHASINKYNLHKISSEHIILKYFMPTNTSQVTKNKSLNFSYQLSEKNTENGEYLQNLVVNNCQIKEDCNKKIEAVSGVIVSNTNELLKISDKNESHSIILSTNIDCSEYANRCSSMYRNDQIEVTPGLNSSIKVSCTELSNNIANDNDMLLNTYDLNLKKEVCYERNVIHQDSFPENTITTIINTSNTIIDKTSSRDIKLYEEQKESEADEECFGKYVTQRLKIIYDDSVKSEIKHEIDILFNSIMAEHME